MLLDIFLQPSLRWPEKILVLGKLLCLNKLANKVLTQFSWPAHTQFNYGHPLHEFIK